MLFLVGFLSSTKLHLVESNDRPDLYTSSDNVVRLTSATFKSTVFDKNPQITFVVQFYNTFCGHCQAFSPVYKELATRTKNWTSIVQIAGVDCSKDENLNTCSENNIRGYPTILIFPPDSKFQDPKDEPLDLRSIHIEWTIDDIEDSIIDYVTNLTSTSRHYPPTINALLPITVEDPSLIKRILPQNLDSRNSMNEPTRPRDLLIVVESKTSYLGKKLIIEYSRISANVEIRRILLSNDKLLKALLTSSDYASLSMNQPILIKLLNSNSDSKAQVLVKGEADHILPTLEDSERQDFILDRFKTFFEHYYSEELKAVSGSTNVEDYRPAKNKAESILSQNNELEIHYLVHNDAATHGRVFAADLLKGISYMLNHEVRIRGDLSPGEFTIIRNLLSVIDKHLPITEWDSTFSRFISDLRTKLDENRAEYEKQGITSQQLNDIYEISGASGIKTRYNRENWISCYESDRQHKGYTCSLWLLFHTLTVGEYTKSRVRSSTVLYTMRDYITQFLGCTVCSSNFAKETQSLDSSLVHKNSSVMWLWNTHNHVSQRINNEKGDEKRHLTAVLFPSHRVCPECYITDPDEIGKDGKTLADIEWNLAKVLDYMERTYNPERLVKPIEMAGILKRVRGKVKYDMLTGKLSNSSVEEKYLTSIFTTGDMGLCFLLYLSCVVIVAIVCLALNPRWRRIKTNKF